MAFLLPIINSLVNASINNNDDDAFYSRKTGAFCIVLVPTRELASQISLVLEKLLQYSNTNCRHWIVSSIVTGGESKKSEKARLRKGVNVLVCTPGRLLDHLNTTESFIVDNLRWLVLDEADNLMHLGFEETLKNILRILGEKVLLALGNGTRKNVVGLPFKRQTILCSATIEGGIKELVQETLNNPLYVLGDSKKNSEKKDVKVDENKNVDESGEIKQGRVVDFDDESTNIDEKTDDIVENIKSIDEKTETYNETTESAHEKTVTKPVEKTVSNVVVEEKVKAEKKGASNIAVPANLKQHFVLSPAKLRLVNLIGLMRMVF